ncbi:hypothetical protein RF11_07923 [Thelohanellus kitauei]|uniref:Uncharacterized protein n=1 Tax=Thelohanellus kitauei TaxID=669202 RepID=A0A0C2J2D5_THEKT|nr:hypothetical protein RF11_07923 [Thelohanellus kitauei]
MLPFSQFSCAPSPQFGLPQYIVTLNQIGGHAMQPHQPATHLMTKIQPAPGVTHVIHSGYNSLATSPFQLVLNPTMARNSIADPSLGIGFGMGRGMGFIGGSGVNGGMDIYPSSNPRLEKVLKKRMRRRRDARDLRVLPYIHPLHALYYYPPTHPFLHSSKPKNEDALNA